MAVNRITTDVSDGNNSRGMAFGTSYLIANDIPSGATLTRIDSRLEWDFEPNTVATTVTSFALSASYPYIVAYQTGTTGFTPVAPSIANYGMSAFLKVQQIPTVAESSSVLPGSTDMFYWFTITIAFTWIGELHLSAGTDIWLQAAAQHDATPQTKLQQHGTANVFYS